MKLRKGLLTGVAVLGLGLAPALATTATTVVQASQVVYAVGTATVYPNTVVNIYDSEGNVQPRSAVGGSAWHTTELVKINGKDMYKIGVDTYIPTEGVSWSMD